MTNTALRLPLALGLACLLVSPLLTGSVAADDFCLLYDDRDALQARVELIQSAQCEISVAYYAIDKGDVPLGLLALLRKAARRGVRVRVLVDGLQSRMPSDLEQLLTDEGVPFRMFHPPYHGRPGWLNRRLHDKLMVVDRQAMIIGSRNLQDHHFGLDRVNYIDCDALLTGAICQHAAKHFDWLWEHRHVRRAEKSNSFGLDLVDNLQMKVPPGPFLRAERLEEYEAALDESLQAVQKIVADGGTLCDCGNTKCVTEVQACLFHDERDHKSERKLQSRIVKLIDSAATSIHIETAYPVFSEPIFDALRGAATRGVCVSMLTNSLESTDSVSAYADYQNQKAELLGLGVRLFELCGRDHLHVKTMVVDRRIAMLGSYNFDRRSDRLNLELCAVVCDRRVAELLLQSGAKRLSNAQQIAARPVVQEIGGNPRKLKCARLRMTQLLVPLYRSSL